MTAVDLSTLDYHLLKATVSKFLLPAGVRFYRSCSSARDFMDTTRPRLSSGEGVEVTYRPFQNELLVHGPGAVSVPMEQLTFIRVTRLLFPAQDLPPRSQQSLESSFLAQMAKFKGTRCVQLGHLDSPAAGQIVSAVRPRWVAFCARQVADLKSAVLKKVPSIEVNFQPLMYSRLLSDPSPLFAAGHEELKLVVYIVGQELAIAILEVWLQGAATGSLRRLAISNRTTSPHTFSFFQLVHSHFESGGGAEIALEEGTRSATIRRKEGGGRGRRVQLVYGRDATDQRNETIELWFLE